MNNRHHPNKNVHQLHKIMSTSTPNNDKSQQYEYFEMSLLTKCQRGSGHSTSISSQPKTTLHNEDVI